MSDLESVLKYIKNGKVLELGCGDGHNAIFLAQHGFDVVAQDISKIALDALGKTAKEKDLRIFTWRSAAQDFVWKENYILVVCKQLLHSLPAKDAEKLLTNMQFHTQTEGLNAVAVMLNEGELFQSKQSDDQFFIPKGKILDYYQGWEILEHDVIEMTVNQTKPDGTPIKNFVERILARKK